MVGLLGTGGELSSWLESVLKLPVPGLAAGAFLECMERSESALGAGRAVGAAVAGPLWSHRAAWEEFLVAVPVEAGRAGLGLGGDWPGRWTVTWKAGGDQVSCPVRELIQAPMVDADPIRCFPGSGRRDIALGFTSWSVPVATTAPRA